MAVSRYARSLVLDAGRQLGTSRAHEVIRNAIRTKSIQYDVIVLKGSERLDTIAGEVYGDASYWWILAAASGIGWGLQVPPGTVIKVPNLQKVIDIVR